MSNQFPVIYSFTFLCSECCSQNRAHIFVTEHVVLCDYCSTCLERAACSLCETRAKNQHNNENHMQVNIS